MEIKKSFDTLTRVTKIVVELSDEEMNGIKDPLTFFLTRSAVLNGQNKSLKAEVEMMAKDNERLRAEIVRLSGGEKSSERITGASRLALKAMESKSICRGCAFSTAGFNGGFFCRHHSPSREIYFVDIVDTGRPKWCPL